MGKRDYFAFGDNNAICDRCGAKFKASELDEDQGRRGSHGLYVCSTCWDPPQGQDYVKGVKDDMSVELARIRGPLQFITDPVLPEDL